MSFPRGMEIRWTPSIDWCCDGRSPPRRKRRYAACSATHPTAHAAYTAGLHKTGFVRVDCFRESQRIRNLFHRCEGLQPCFDQHLLRFGEARYVKVDRHLECNSTGAKPGRHRLHHRPAEVQDKQANSRQLKQPRNRQYFPTPSATRRIGDRLARDPEEASDGKQPQARAHQSRTAQFTARKERWDDQRPNTENQRCQETDRQRVAGSSA